MKLNFGRFLKGNAKACPQHTLIDGGLNLCKPPYCESALRAQFHEIKDETFWKILPEVHDFTMLSMETMWSLYEAVRYVARARVKGDVVECGVLYGGSMMLIAKTLLSLGVTDRRLWLYDSFEGFTGKPAKDDIDWMGGSVSGKLPDFMQIVVDNIQSTGYPFKNVTMIQGDIEQTAPINNNGDIAMLRLDTDTYYSTRAEMDNFFPKLVSGGVLIIDDYGHALGARRAVDEYFRDHQIYSMLHRVNFTNRIMVK
jgi:O-methyltransferase